MSRFFVGGVVIAVGLIAGVVFWSPRPGSGPEPISYGRDTCARCRMIISQPGFSAEKRDSTGRLFKYDDIGCLLLALRDEHRPTPESWVEDHDSHRFVPLLTATLVRAEQLDTPMNHKIAALENVPAAEAFARSHGGAVVSLEAVLRDETLLAAERKELGR